MLVCVCFLAGRRSRDGSAPVGVLLSVGVCQR